ncbi:Midnolin [Larimichthys crocea]|uniref:Uncharacterized protein n=1 Tax=Larimichthys crocea TaxID=215358 RepID=A0ACD3QT70_LARCR|nr:Midnolin [Larimichthys crocea]
MEQQKQQQQQQRGLCSFTPGRSACFGTGVSTSTGQPTMRLSITSTTGSPVELTVPRGETVEGLRTHISQKLRLQTNRIVLLYRDRQLTAGKLMDLGVADGSKLTLVPVIEAGLVCSTVKAERSIIDVLESLTEVQISDFLSGRSPLTINLGIGAHVMYVQLQLSAQNVAELQQQHWDLRAEGSSERQTGLPTTVRTSHPDSAWTNSTGSTTSPASQTSTPTPDSSDSASSTQFSAQSPRTSSNSTAPMPHSSTTATAVNCHHHSSPHQPCPPNSTHTSSSSISTPHFSIWLSTSQLSIASSHTGLFIISRWLHSWTSEPSASLNLSREWCSCFIHCRAVQAARSSHRKFREPLSRHLLWDFFWHSGPLQSEQHPPSSEWHQHHSPDPQ